MTDHQNEDLLRLQEAETLLSKNKTSIPALRTKVIALIKLDRDRDALSLFDEHPKLQEAATAFAVTGKAGQEGNQKKDGQLECAYVYALYKCGRFEDVKRKFGGDEHNTNLLRRGRGRGLRHVLAQAVGLL